MFNKCRPYFFISLAFGLYLLSGWALAQGQVVVGGTFYDYRYGDILLGPNNLTLAPQAKITVKGEPLPVSQLGKKYLKMVGCAHLNELGLVAELHLDPLALIHRSSCDFAFLDYGPQGQGQGGEPVFVRFYASPELLSDNSLRLYIDGQPVSSGQIKHPGFIYYPASLSPGPHHFRLEVERSSGSVDTLEWTTSPPRSDP